MARIFPWKGFSTPRAWPAITRFPSQSGRTTRKYGIFAGISSNTSPFRRNTVE
jgi:hypothetical protein